MDIFQHDSGKSMGDTQKRTSLQGRQSQKEPKTTIGRNLK